MKATKEQQAIVARMLDSECGRMNLRIAAICTIGDCWILLTRALCRVDDDLRPLDCGNTRDWLFAGLDDSHLETVFKSILPKLALPKKVTK